MMNKPSLSKFYIHVAQNLLMSVLLIIFALFLGMVGYHEFEGMPWIDSFLNASMILSGMGPATVLATTGGKLFAGLYALFSGLVFIALIVIMISPLIHHLFRKIHIEGGRG